MTRRPGSLCALALVVACWWLSAALPTAFGEDAKGDTPVVVKPTTPVEPHVDLDKELTQHPATLIALISLKWLPASLGLAVIAVALVNRRDRRDGLIPPLEPAPAMTVPFSLGWALLLIVGGMFLVPTLLQLAVSGVPQKGVPGEAQSLAVRLSITAAGLVPLALLVATRRRRLQREGAPRPVPASTAVWEAAKTFCVACTVTVAVGLLTKIVLERVFNLPQQPQDLIEILLKPRHPADRFILAVYGVLGAPVVEEFVFRGMLQPAVTRVSGRFTGMIVTSIIFALVHVNKLADIHSFFPLLALALLLSWLFERTNSILATTTVHALNNGTTLLPLLMLPPS